MALQSCDFESICREIHDSWGNPNHQIHRFFVGLSQFDWRGIRETYLRTYGEDPVHHLLLLQRNEAGASWKALSMLMLGPHERDAYVARQALEQRNGAVNYRALIEIFLCRKSSHVLLIQEAYCARFKQHLEQDIICIEPSHPYQRILMALCASHKAHQVDVSHDIAKCDARRLYQTGLGRKPGKVDEAVVLEILSKRSIPQFRLAFSCYKHIYGHSYTRSLESENSGEFEDALRVVVKCISNPPKYYSETLYECIKGTRIDIEGMIRVMTSRPERDMNEIQRAFKKRYGMELKTAIYENTPQEDYRELLISLATKSATTHVTPSL